MYAIILYEEEVRIDPIGNEILIIYIYIYINIYIYIYKMSYQSYSVSLTEAQKANLARAYKNKSPITIRLKNEQLRGNFYYC